MNAIAKIEARYIRNDLPEFRPGDTVRVHAKIQEAGITHLGIATKPIQTTER